MALLLKSEGIDVNAADSSGATALMRAAEKGALKVRVRRPQLIGSYLSNKLLIV